MIFFLLTASRSNFYIAFALQSYKTMQKQDYTLIFTVNL